MTQVDEFLDDLDRLAATAATADPATFYRELLPAAAMAIDADAADYTPLLGGAGVAPVRWPDARCAADSLLEPERLARVGAERIPRVVSAAGDGAPVIACPVEGSSAPAGVLAFQLRADAAASGVERRLELAAGVAEVAARYELRVAAHNVAGAQQRLARVEQTLLKLHRARRAAEVASVAAESGRRLIDCDRLSVLTRSGNAWRVAAVSGVSKVSRRSDAARQMAELVRVVDRQFEEITTPLDRETTPAELCQLIDTYQDATGVGSLMVRPCPASESHEDADLRPDQPHHAVLLAEWFDTDTADDADSLLSALARHVGVAMLRTSSRLSSARAVLRGVSALLLVALIAGVVLVASFWPATLWIAVDGRFEPIDRARAFAPLDGVVEEVLVDQAEHVIVGQPLVRLSSPELRLQQEEVAEAIATTEAELAALATAKLRAALPGRSDEPDASTLASRSAALREKLGHQQARQALLEEQATRLMVVSPMAGVVVSWRPHELLADRPVSRGQRLLEIVGGESWRIELDAPDQRSGPILNARAERENLPVEYVVRSDPAVTHRGTVTRIAETTQAGPEGMPILRIIVTPEQASAANPRTGLGVSAKINCGEHSLGYVWLHDAIAAVRRWWF